MPKGYLLKFINDRLLHEKHNIKMKIVVTGGAGFVGSHVAEHYAKRGEQVVVIDNLSRNRLLNKKSNGFQHSWNYLSKFRNIRLVKADVNNEKILFNETKDADAIVHAAAQTAVTSSLANPREDFINNTLATFNALEAARKNDVKFFIYCSTNKVYGENVNRIAIKELEKRYAFTGKYAKGIDETLSVDLCEHSPYGCSKLASDIYAQDYGHVYGIKTGVFRMSCIYGTRQFGVEDQGWVAWFAIATLLSKPITIYGDGKQIRDVLFVTDVVSAYDAFIKKSMASQVFNLGGGPEFSMSLLELIGMLKKLTGKRSKIRFDKWRVSDQKVYISDISKAKKLLGWKPKISPKEGVRILADWAKDNIRLFG